MKKLIIQNAAIETFLSQFRNAQSSTHDCNVCVENMSIFLAGEISNYLEIKNMDIETPLGKKSVAL